MLTAIYEYYATNHGSNGVTLEMLFENPSEVQQQKIHNLNM